MGYLDNTGLTYLWERIKSLLAGGTSQKAQSIPFGEVDSTSVATAFTATVEGITALEDGVCCYLKNTVVTSAAATVAPKCWTLDINELGAKPVYVTTAAATFSTTHFSKNYKMLFTYDSSLNSGNGGWYIGQLFNSNTTYSDMTQAEIDAGTGTTGRKITPKMLRDNFYTEDEVDALIPTVPTKVSDLTNDAGYITGYTETDPTVPSWAKASTKPSYTASEVGALPDTTVIPTESTVSGWGFTKNTGTITGITMNGASKGTSGVVDLGTVVTDVSGKANTADLATVATSGSYTDLDDKPTIPTVPTTLSSFTDDLGSSPTHTHSQYLTSAPVTSVNGQTGAVSLSIPTVPSNIVTGLNSSGVATAYTIKVVDSLPGTTDPSTIYLVTGS